MAQQLKEGSNTTRYACEYEYQGHKWAAYIDAPSFEEAEARLRCLGRGKVLGELVATIPVPVNENTVTKIIKWLREILW